MAASNSPQELCISIAICVTYFCTQEGCIVYLVIASLLNTCLWYLAPTFDRSMALALPAPAPALASALGLVLPCPDLTALGSTGWIPRNSPWDEPRQTRLETAGPTFLGVFTLTLDGFPYSIAIVADLFNPFKRRCSLRHAEGFACRSRAHTMDLSSILCTARMSPSCCHFCWSSINAPENRMLLDLKVI
jgi:hypothetical protein